MALNVCLVIGCAVVCLQYVQYRHCNSNTHVLHAKMSLCANRVFCTFPVRDAEISLCTDSKVRKKQRLKFCTLPELFNGHAGSTGDPTGTTACCGQRVQ